MFTRTELSLLCCLSVLFILSTGCEDVSSDLESYSMEENATGDGSVVSSSNGGSLAAGEFAGEARGGEDTSMGMGGEQEYTPEDCLMGYLATPLMGEQVCLEGFAALDASAEASMRSDQGLCGLEDSLSQRLSNGNEDKVICEDQDQDCYYTCEGWTLDERLEDPDDQRNFIPSLLGRVDPDVPMGEDACDMLRAAEYGYCCEQRVEGRAYCHRKLKTDFSERVRIVSPCHGGGIAWIVEQMNGLFELRYGKLDAQNELLPLELEAPEVTLPLPTRLGAPQRLICFFSPDQGMRGMVSGASKTLDFFAKNNRGTYEVVPFYSEEISFPTLGLGLDWSVSHLSAQEDGLFNWELGVTIGEEERALFQDFCYGPFASRGISRAVTGSSMYTLTCSECSNDGTSGEVITATLNQEGKVELTILDYRSGLSDQLTYEAPSGAIASIQSSKSLLGMMNARLSNGLMLNERLLFTVWGSAELRMIPLTVEASRWGAEQIELISLNGFQALIKLTRGDESSLGLYDVLSDQLSILSLEGLIDTLPEDDVKNPFMRAQHLIWFSQDPTNPDQSVVAHSLSLKGFDEE